MIIKRDFYLDRLVRAKGDGFVKIVTGIRRCGKSFLLFRLFKSHLLKEGVPRENIVEVELDKKKIAAGDKMSDEDYQKQLSDIKNGDIYGNGQKIQTMTVIIKPMDTANYNNMVQALDEMQICSIGKYVIDKINEDDEKLLTLKGIKFAAD